MVSISRGLKQQIAILLVAGIGGAVAYHYLVDPVPAIPQRRLRIGFEVNPPFQSRTNGVLGGLAVETVAEAARRAGIQLEWVETGLSSDESFAKGLVDLWPLMADLPERRKRVHITKPWLLSSNVLVTRAGDGIPEPDFTGHIAVFRLPLRALMAQQKFPHAHLDRFANVRDGLQEVCSGVAGAAFLDRREAMNALTDPPSGCASVRLGIHNVENQTIGSGVASTFECAGAADLLRREIGEMYREGTLKATMAKYTFYGLDDDTYELMATADRLRWIALGTAGFAIAVLVALWLALSLRQRNRSERVLRESEERFRSIFQQAGVGVAQIGLDGKVEVVNDRYCEVVGHTRDALLGRGTVEITHPEDVRERLAILPRLMAGEIQSFSTEKRYERNDGTVVWAEICKSLVRGADGKPKCYIAVVQDITERKLAEAAMRESEERFRHMADSAPVLIWISGPDKQCTFFNKGWLEFTGRTMDQELGDGWVEGVHPDDRERCVATYCLAFEARESFEMEYRVRRADGEYRWMLDQGTARLSPDGTFAGYIGSCIDVTDLKRNYEQHVATQKLESLGVLAAGVAHDFNNLLGAIVARTDSAESALSPETPAAEDIEQIRVTALRAAEIVSQLMTFAKQENAPSAAIDLSALVAEILDLLRVSISKTAALKTELHSHLQPISGNAAEIRQVVMNLIINASEALEGKPGTITIATSPAGFNGEDGGAVRLEVRDTGCGMTEEVKARIFDPFFTTRFVGRGLGLSAVQGIIRRHGGLIEVESSPGRGSRFTILLPSTTELLPSARATAESDDASDHAIAVLFIEDDESLRSPVARILRKMNFQVFEAPDGAAGIRTLRLDPAGIDLVVLDVTLPGIAGAELLDELYKISPGLKVILSTAYSRETAASEFAGRRFSGFIRKPYRTGELAKLLHEVAGSEGSNGNTETRATSTDGEVRA